MKFLMKLFIKERMFVHLQFDIEDISQAFHQKCSATEGRSGIGELKQTNAAAVNWQISIQIQIDGCQGSTEFTWP